jgi:hypothetical protein
MSNWLLDKLASTPSEIKEDQLTIWVLHADKKPPHIGISIESKFFSLKINGKDENLPIASLIQLIHKKQIPTLRIQLNLDETFVNVGSVFSNYGSKIKTPETCLSPITELLLPTYKDLILIELLDELKEKNQIETISSFYLPEDYRGIPEYTRETIKNRLHAIQSA